MAKSTLYVSLSRDMIVSATMLNPELTYYADGTPLLMSVDDGRTGRAVVAVGITDGMPPYQLQAVRYPDGTIRNVVPHVLYRTR